MGQIFSFNNSSQIINPINSDKNNYIFTNEQTNLHTLSNKQTHQIEQTDKEYLLDAIENIKIKSEKEVVTEAQDKISLNSQKEVIITVGSAQVKIESSGLVSIKCKKMNINSASSKIEIE